MIGVAEIQHAGIDVEYTDEESYSGAFLAVLGYSIVDSCHNALRFHLECSRSTELGLNDSCE